MHTIRQVIYNDIDLEMMNKAIHWAETAIPHRYVWEELYDVWDYPFTYRFVFVEKTDMLLFKLLLNGKQVNT
jgi:hypothetical protein|tara:strand:+ start:345 stop:560 length:216 start_codon:yes stop_codon:yes gene_type:complete